MNQQKLTLTDFNTLTNLIEIISSFDSISLHEMESVALMNRTDTKFIFRAEQLPLILNKVQNDYKMLSINNIRANKYETLYFDTQDFKLYMAHHRGKSNRYKVRHRIYVDSNLHYFEIKFKNNKGRTIKNRIKKRELEQTICGKSEEFLKEYSNLTAQNLVPKLWSNCSRITLVNKKSKERLTLDINLQFKNECAERTFSNIVIAEVKQEKFSPSPFIKLMKQLKIKSGSISKYCFGVISLYDQIKRNNFKEKLKTINKINNYEFKS